jgi:hypothetical protein
MTAYHKPTVSSNPTDRIPPDQIKPGYRFGRRVVTGVHTEHMSRVIHVDSCACRCAFFMMTYIDPVCTLQEWTDYWYTVRCDCGCVRVMDWWSVTHGGRLTCNRIMCECTPKRFPDLYCDIKSGA